MTQRGVGASLLSITMLLLAAVVGLPFYYIDYTLALCCALQMWASSYDDPAGTLERYVRLCGRGGEAAFRNLITSAGLASPFEPGALSRVVARAKDVLGF